MSFKLQAGRPLGVHGEAGAFEYRVGGIQLPLPAVNGISAEGEQYMR